VHAKIPLDVDLEDKLLYGLTPTRLAYLVVALLLAFSTWSSQLAAAPIRAGAASLIVLIGAALAWGRWHSRAADNWIVDATLFVLTNYQIAWNHRRVRRTYRSMSKRPIDHEAVLKPLADAA
jgi:hypothetical protein